MAAWDMVVLAIAAVEELAIEVAAAVVAEVLVDRSIVKLAIEPAVAAEVLVDR